MTAAAALFDTKFVSSAANAMKLATVKTASAAGPGVAVVTAGGAQGMTAGRGIVHAERPLADRTVGFLLDSPVEGLVERSLVAMQTPSGSSRSQAKSWLSEMISENAVRHTPADAVVNLAVLGLCGAAAGLPARAQDDPPSARWELGVAAGGGQHALVDDGGDGVVLVGGGAVVGDVGHRVDG